MFSLIAVLILGSIENFMLKHPKQTPPSPPSQAEIKARRQKQAFEAYRAGRITSDEYFERTRNL